MQLEAAGVPTVVVTTTRFTELTATVARNLRIDARTLIVDHPLGGTDEPTIVSWADAAVEATIALFAS